MNYGALISHPRTHTHTASGEMAGGKASDKQPRDTPDDALSAPRLTRSMAKDISEFITLASLPKKDSVQTFKRLRAQHLCPLKMEKIGGALFQAVFSTVVCLNVCVCVCVCVCVSHYSPQ